MQSLSNNYKILYIIQRIKTNTKCLNVQNFKNVFSKDVLCFLLSIRFFLVRDAVFNSLDS